MPAPTVKAFLDTLKRRLDELSAEELQAAVLRFARGLEPREREPFLEVFATAQPSSGRTGPQGTKDKKVLQEVRAFAKRVEAGEYADGWGWDDELREERLFGDESWMDEVQCFLAAARGYFEDGEWELSRDLAHGVFEAIQAGLYDGLLPGDETVVPPDAALEEEVYRYLRAVYRTAEPAERPRALMDGFQTAWGLVPGAGLRGLLEVSDEELPGLDVFGDAWISFLDGAEAGSPMARLLHEAARIFRGAEGLATLARRIGREDPEAYVAWVVHLQSEGQLQEAADAALEALGILPGDLAVRARLADLLRTAAEALGDAETVDRARQEAFFAGPTLTRMLCWIEGAADDAELGLRLAKAGSRVEEVEARRAEHRTPLEMQEEMLRSRSEPGLRSYIQLLCGEYAAVVKALENAKPLGWSAPDHPGPLGVPFFLAAAGGLGAVPLGPNLEALWGRASEIPVVHFGAALRDADQPARSLRLHLTEALGRFPLNTRSGQRFFRVAEEAALARVDAIVSGQHRRSYEHAAKLLLAVADGHRCLGGTDEARRLVARVRARYPRHRAFLAELRAAATGSPTAY